MKKREKIIAGVTIGALSALAGYSVIGSNYADFPGWSSDVQIGRTKNAVATVVTGIVAHDMYENSEFEIEMHKFLWPDSIITGTTDADSIDALMDLALTKSHFIASEADSGLEGEVKKSEFNWKVEELDDGTYSVSRMGPKWDRVLTISVEDGIIQGTYDKPFGPVDWNFEGTYDTEGNVFIDFDIPFQMDFDLKGTITQIDS